MQRRPRISVGATELELIPSTSPNSSEYTSGAYSLLRLTKRAPRASIITSISAVTAS